MRNTGRNRNFSSGMNNNPSSTNSGGNGSDYKPWKKTLADHVYYIGSAKQAADYQTTTDYVINHITKTFEFGSDIAFTLKKEKPYSMDKHKPTLKPSTMKSSLKLTMMHTQNGNNYMNLIPPKHMH
jgi:hypothetical protein